MTQKPYPFSNNALNQTIIRNVRYAAVQELARVWKDDPETLPMLKQRAQSDNGSDCATCSSTRNSTGVER